MKHTLIEIKTGTIVELDDDITEEKKKYYELMKDETYLEWFIR